MDLGKKLLDTAYVPSNDITNFREKNISFSTAIKCPVSFTDDPLEYVEGFLNYRLKKVQRLILTDLFSVDTNNNPIYKEAVVISGMRCLKLGTEILMYDGTLKKIENIKVDELAMGPDSKPRKVLDISKGTSELFEVRQSCADTYVVNENHILSLKKSQSSGDDRTDRQPNGRYPNDPDLMNIPIKEYLKKSAKWKYFFRGYKAGVIEFLEQSVPIDPYLLSVWLGNGSNYTIKICNMKNELVDWLYEYVAKNDLLIHEYRKKGNKAIDYTISKKKTKFLHVNPLLNEFRKLNLMKNKHIPQCYISNSKEIRLKTLAGLLDTDGYYSKHGYEIALANEVLARDTKRLADTLGYRTYIRKKKTTNQDKNFKGVVWRLTIHGDVWEIPCKVSIKKYKHTGKFSNKENYLSSLKVKSIGRGKYAGIAVDKDNLYCLSDCTVIHNSGKSVLGGIIGSFLLQKLLGMDDPGAQLGQLPGQKFSAEYIATSEQQSKQTAFSNFETIITSTPWWKKYISYLYDRESTEGKETLFQHHARSVTFPEKNLEILSLHSNSASIAGLTAFFVCFDEMSRFDVSEGDIQQRSEKRSAQAVYYTAARAAKTLKNFSKIITITSPMYETDFGMQLLYMAKEIKGGSSLKTINALRERYTMRVSNMIGYHFNTFEANPKTQEDPNGFTEEDFQAEKVNYLTYMRDYLAIPPSAISPFFDLPERINNSVTPNYNPIVVFSNEIMTESVGYEKRNYIGKKIYIASPNKIQKYFICCDQGAVKDSFAVAMGHAAETTVKVPDARGGLTDAIRNKIIIDFVEAWKPNKEQRVTVSFQNVEDTIRTLNSYFYIDKVVFDSWHSTESIERLFSEGVITRKLGATIEMYETMKILLYSGMIELPDSDLLLTELRQLNVIKGSRIEHPFGGCFTGDTKIKLFDGISISIEELSKRAGGRDFFIYASTSTGDIVATYGCNAHETKKVNDLTQVELNTGEYLRCTPEHFFKLKNGSYKEARLLKAGDSLMSMYPEKNHSVKNISFIFSKEEIPVYDISVPKHSNFALESGIFVHNSKDLADAVVRVVWCVYLDSIRDAVHGKFMLPMMERFPTVRSVGSMYDTQRNEMHNSMYQSYGIFGNSVGAKGIFGKSMIVEPNVIPTIGDTKLK